MGPPAGSSRLHVIGVNHDHPEDGASLDELLEVRYNLVGWYRGLREAGAGVSVYQRYGRDLFLEREGVPIHFVGESGRGVRRRCLPRRLHRRVAEECAGWVERGVPTVVHVDGLIFPFSTGRLRARLPGSVALVVQHHGERALSRRLLPLQRRYLRSVDGFLFAARALAREWVAAGVIPSTDRVYEVMEGSSPFHYRDRAAARAATGLEGDPVVLWTGNLDANKDPLTVLTAFETVLGSVPGARLYMAFRNAGLGGSVRARIEGSPSLSRTVTLLGEISRARVADYYNSADVFVQGSHREAAGIALLDALACGVIPAVTDIPTFRAITGDGAVGELWSVGDAGDCARALLRAIRRPRAAASRACRERFESTWSFEAIGRRALEAYQDVVARRPRNPPGGSLPGDDGPP